MIVIYVQYSCRIRDIAFFFNDTATTENYTLSLHDALPIFDPDQPHPRGGEADHRSGGGDHPRFDLDRLGMAVARRSEEHTSEIQAPQYLVSRLLLAKKYNISYDELCLNQKY